MSADRLTKAEYKLLVAALCLMDAEVYDDPKAVARHDALLNKISRCMGNGRPAKVAPQARGAAPAPAPPRPRVGGGGNLAIRRKIM